MNKRREPTKHTTLYLSPKHKLDDSSFNLSDQADPIKPANAISPKRSSEKYFNLHKSIEKSQLCLDNTLHAIGEESIIGTDREITANRANKLAMSITKENNNPLIKDRLNSKLSNEDVLNLSNSGIHEFLPSKGDPNNGNQIPSPLPKVIDYTKVTVLKLDNNLLTSLSLDIQNFVFLEELSATFNYISCIPKEIAALKSLKILRLNHNKIESLPIEIGCLINLKQLDIVDNLISRMPTSMYKLIFLEQISLEWFYYTSEKRSCTIREIEGPFIRDFRIIMQEFKDSQKFINFVEYFCAIQHLSTKAILSISFDAKGRNLFHISALRGHLSIVHTLTTYKISVNSQDRDGCTALLLALLNKRCKVAKLLIETTNVDPSIPNHKMDYPIITCISSGYYQLAELILCKTKAVVDCKDSLGNTPMHLLFRTFNKDTEMCHKLTHKLLALNINTNLFNENLLTPFLYSVKKNQKEAVNLCFKINSTTPYFNVNLKGKNGMGALHFASAYTDIGMIKLLINNGISPLEGDAQLYRPSHYSCCASHRKYLLLIEKNHSLSRLNCKAQFFGNVHKFSSKLISKVLTQDEVENSHNETSIIDFYDTQEGMNKNVYNMKLYVSVKACNTPHKPAKNPTYYSIKSMPSNARRALSKGGCEHHQNDGNHTLHPQSIQYAQNLTISNNIKSQRTLLSEIKSDPDDLYDLRITRKLGTLHSGKKESIKMSLQSPNASLGSIYPESMSSMKKLQSNTNHIDILLQTQISCAEYKLISSPITPIYTKYRILYYFLFTSNEIALKGLRNSPFIDSIMSDLDYCLSLLNPLIGSEIGSLLTMRKSNGNLVRHSEKLNIMSVKSTPLFAYNEWFLAEKNPLKIMNKSQEHNSSIMPLIPSMNKKKSKPASHKAPLFSLHI